jgi:hypothetical protein
VFDDAVEVIAEDNIAHSYRLSSSATRNLKVLTAAHGKKERHVCQQLELTPQRILG